MFISNIMNQMIFWLLYMARVYDSTPLEGIARVVLCSDALSALVIHKAVKLNPKTMRRTTILNTGLTN